MNAPTTWSVDQQDIMIASWAIATLIYGPDDGSDERDDIECQIQAVMRDSFVHTTGDGAEHKRRTWQQAQRGLAGIRGTN